MFNFLPNPQTLDPAIVQRAMRIDPSLHEQLLPPGTILPSGFVDFCSKRKREFIAGRLCSIAAIQHLFASPLASPIGCDEHGLPVWPQGVVGSISHSQGYARAAVALSNQVRGLGIDSEYLVNNSLSSSLAGKILTHYERTYCADLAFLTGKEALTLGFSAKESLYKCLYPLVQKKFYFSAAELVAITCDGNFTIKLVENLSQNFAVDDCFEGSFHFSGNLVHTAVVIP